MKHAKLNRDKEKRYIKH